VGGSGRARRGLLDRGLEDCKHGNHLREGRFVAAL
jgi:hypothetical protein